MNQAGSRREMMKLIDEDARAKADLSATRKWDKEAKHWRCEVRLDSKSVKGEGIGRTWEDAVNALLKSCKGTKKSPKTYAQTQAKLSKLNQKAKK